MAAVDMASTDTLLWRAKIAENQGIDTGMSLRGKRGRLGQWAQIQYDSRDESDFATAGCRARGGRGGWPERVWCHADVGSAREVLGNRWSGQGRASALRAERYGMGQSYR